MEKIKATPIAVEEDVSRTNQTFWRVKLDSGDTLYTYQGSTIKDLELKKPNVFLLEKKGRYFHIADTNPGADEDGYEPVDEDGYPSSWNAKEKEAIETVATPQAGFTKSHSQSYGKRSWGSNRASSGGSRGNNASFALSYAKDIIVAMIAAGQQPTGEDWFAMASEAKTWLDENE